MQSEWNLTLVMGPVECNCRGVLRYRGSSALCWHDLLFHCALQCQGAELHLQVALDPVVVIIDVVGVYQAVLKPVPINSAWSKTYILTQKSTFYNVREMSYTLKWPWTLLSALMVLVYIGEFWNLFQSTQHGQKHISWHKDQPSTMSGSWVTPWSGPGPCCCH